MVVFLSKVIHRVPTETSFSKSGNIKVLPEESQEILGELRKNIWNFSRRKKMGTIRRNLSMVETYQTFSAT